MLVGSLGLVLALSPSQRISVSRRDALSAALLTVLPQRAVGEEAGLVERRITERVKLSIAVGTDEPQSLVIGLYGEAAPSSTKLFSDLCSARVPDAPGMSYVGSVASRVERDKAIVMGRPPAGEAQYLERTIDSTGYVRTSLINRADSFTNADLNQFSHDRAGVVSMRRGGGDFEFLIAPAANPTLDAERIIIGEVVEGLGLVAEMNAVPARKPSKDNEVGAVIYALGAYDESRYLSVAKAGGDPRARIDQTYRPLKKIKIMSCGAPGLKR